MRSTWLFGVAFLAMASTARAQNTPTGFLDTADCTHIVGWAQDPDEPTRAIDVHLYFDAPAGTANARAISLGPANIRRADLCEPLKSCEHGYEIPTPFGLLDDQEHTVFAYGIDATGDANLELSDSRKTFTCAPSIPPSSKRHITDFDTFKAWGFDVFLDVLRVREDLLAKMPDGPGVSSPPVVVRGDDGSADMWLVDGNTRHRIAGPEVIRQWRFDLAKVTVRPVAEIKALTEASPLRTRPWLAQGSGDTIYVLYALDDALAPTTTGPGATNTPNGGSNPPVEEAPAAKHEDGCSTSGQTTGPAPYAAVLALAYLLRRRSQSPQPEA